ncbi:hypothetical protein HQ393_01165 [Chitinibacter bivalviorum]|uniref:DUF3298 domain-containing protein n=1 Tax=Chitinibacter bivalviorum TaxID=2739434 RepID=A0A7H9BG98_9NEIS|nr:hypothetical protein [Chitinibacter bivalviorum]QLG86961.1 hypothetical protein HQ393_01165 [Chitinibacter bivalviorum]
MLRLGLAAALLTHCVYADDAAWQGVWQGQLGAQPITVCLQYRDNSSYGAYYLQGSRATISLRLYGNHAGKVSIPDWIEGDEAGNPRWTLLQLQNGLLTGVWRNDNETRPISLQAVPLRWAKGYETAGICASEGFSQALLSSATLRSKTLALNGQSYRIMTANYPPDSHKNISRIALLGEDELRFRSGRMLKAEMSKAQSEALECDLASLGQYGRLGELTDREEAVLIAPQWLVIKHTQSGDCAGAHPYFDVTYRTINRPSGAEINPWQWLSPIGVELKKGNQSMTAAPTPLLRNLILKAWPPTDAECLQVVKDEERWTVYPDARGLVFTPKLPHAMSACSAEVLMPYAKINKILNADGKAAVASLQANGN